MRRVLTRGRGTQATGHWAPETAERTLCGRVLIARDELPSGAPYGSMKECATCHARHEDARLREEAVARRAEAEQRELAERRGRGVWRTRKSNGQLTEVLIADMEESHIVAALAICQRRAWEIGLDPASVEGQAYILRRWPSHPQLWMEGLRRVGLDELERRVRERVGMHRQELDARAARLAPKGAPEPEPDGLWGRPRRAIRVREVE